MPRRPRLEGSAALPTSQHLDLRLLRGTLHGTHPSVIEFIISHASCQALFLVKSMSYDTSSYYLPAAARCLVFDRQPTEKGWELSHRYKVATRHIMGDGLCTHRRNISVGRLDACAWLGLYVATKRS